jgi:hypothetical protein
MTNRPITVHMAVRAKSAYVFIGSPIRPPHVHSAHLLGRCGMKEKSELGAAVKVAAVVVRNTTRLNLFL